MKELNELFSKACLASELGKKGIRVGLQELSHVRDEFFALMRRAEAAEAKLADLVHDDYFASLVSKARNSADKAMVKFPQPNYVLLKVAEEAGEVVQAGVHYAENRMTWQEVEGEIVQLLAMLIRLVTEGDQVNGITPPESCRAAILRNIEEQSQ